LLVGALFVKDDGATILDSDFGGVEETFCFSVRRQKEFQVNNIVVGSDICGETPPFLVVT